MAVISEKSSCLALEGKGPCIHRKIPGIRQWKVKTKTKHTTIIPQQMETSPLLLFMHQNINDLCIRSTEKEKLSSNIVFMMCDVLYNILEN